jgi:hypothetical protein
MATILIIEDDRETNDAICEYLNPLDIVLFRPMMAVRHWMLLLSGKLTLLFSILCSLQ